jgi:hypothetical protein
MKISSEAHKDIIEAYTIDLMSMQEIADTMHVSRTAIHKFLVKSGVDTSKHKITVSCTTCGNPITRTRKRVRTQRNHFCGRECYNSFLDAGKSTYTQNRHGQRIARSVVKQYFDIQPEHVVHHEDRNNFNNRLDNLMVFATAGDHIRYHHATRDKYVNRLIKKSKHREAWDKYHPYEITPIWKGKI